MMKLGGILIALWFLAIRHVLSSQDAPGWDTDCLVAPCHMSCFSNQDVTGWETNCLVVPCHMSSVVCCLASSLVKLGCCYLGD